MKQHKITLSTIAVGGDADTKLLAELRHNAAAVEPMLLTIRPS